jgi:hypothetical protein
LEEISTLIRQSLSDAQTNLGYTYPPPNAPPVRSAVPVAGRFLGLDNTATQLKYAVSQFRAANPGTNPESLSSSIAKAEQALTMVASAQAAKDANINDGRAHNVGDLQGPFQGNVSYVKRAGDIQIQLSMIVANLGQRADPSTLPRTEEWNVSLLMNDGTVLEQLSRSPIPPARPPGVGNAGTSYAMMHFFFKLPNSGNPAAVVVKFKDQTQRISLKSN